MNLGYSVSGFAVGMLVGMTGVGGGSLMTPLLVLLFGIHPATAVGTDLLYAATTKATGTLVHGLKGTVDWRVVGLLAAGSIPATMVTLGLMYLIGARSSGASTIMSVVLGLALFITAASLIFRKKFLEFAQKHTGPRSLRHTGALTVLTGLILGILVSLTSVGAGAIGVTALFLLYPQLPTKRIVGSDVAHAVPLTLIAGLGHWLLGSVDWSLLGSLLVGSLPGIVLGSVLSSKVPDKLLRAVLAATLALVGGRLMFG